MANRSIIDRTSECRDGRQRHVSLDRRSLIVIHRCGLGETAAEIARGFREIPDAAKATGGEMPYTFIVGRGGCIEQALEISERGPHARNWSTRGVGVGVVGDFRLHAPPPLQWSALVWLCSVLAPWLGGHRAIYGHTDLDAATWDKDKICPGPLLCVDDLRASVRDESAMGLTDLGVRW
jgi:hypothetical protein